MAVKLKLPINYEIADDQMSQMSQMSYFEEARYSNWGRRCSSFCKGAIPISAAISLIAITEILALGETWQAANDALAGGFLWIGLYWAKVLSNLAFRLPVILNVDLFLSISQAWDNDDDLTKNISIQLIQLLFGIQVVVFAHNFVFSKRKNDPTDGIDIEKKSDRNYIKMLWGNSAQSQVVESMIKIGLGIGGMYGSRWAIAPFRQFSMKVGRILFASGTAKATTVALIIAVYRAEKRVLNQLGQDRFTSGEQLTRSIRAGRIAKLAFWGLGHFVFGIIGLDTPATDFISGFCNGIKESMDTFCYTHTPLTEPVDAEVEGGADSSCQTTLIKVAHFVEGGVVFGYLTWQGVITTLKGRVALAAFGLSIAGSILTAKWIKVPQAGAPISKVHATFSYYSFFSPPSLLFYNAALQVTKVNSQAMNDQDWTGMILPVFAYSILGWRSGLRAYQRINPKKHSIIASYTPNDEGHDFFSQYVVVWSEGLNNSPGLK